MEMDIDTGVDLCHSSLLWDLLILDIQQQRY